MKQVLVVCVAIGVITVAAGLFFASCYALRVPEMHEVYNLLRRRLRVGK